MNTKIFNLNTTICDSVHLVDPFPVGWIITWFNVTQDVVNIVDGLASVPLWILNCWLHKFLIMVLSFFDVLQVQRVVLNHVFGEIEITLFYSGIISVRQQLGFVLFIQYCFGNFPVFCWSPFLFFLEGKHGRFIRQSVMSLSSISNECDDSFLLPLFAINISGFLPH